MAISGILVHTLKEDLTLVEEKIRNMSGMTSYGSHQDQYIVVVAEAPSDKLEKAVEGIEELDGVLAIYTTYVTMEDEMVEA